MQANKIPIPRGSSVVGALAALFFFGALLGFPGLTRAGSLTLNFDTTFSNANNPLNSGPWLTASRWPSAS